MPALTRPHSDPGSAEHWRIDAGAADIATLDIAPSAHRRRVFAIDVRLVVRAGAGAWHALAVDLDGVREWSRRIDSHPGTDTLDHHCRRVLEAGQALRVRATSQVGGGAQRQRLLIEAEEQPAR